MTRTQCSHTDVAFFPIACDDTIYFNDRPESDLIFTSASSKDSVNHPDHYNKGDIECIDAMLAAAGTEATKNFCQLSCFKYLWRFKHKNGVEDLKKAEWYLKKLIELSKVD